MVAGARGTSATWLRTIQSWALVSFAAVYPLGKAPGEITLGIALLAWVARTLLGQRRPVIPRNPLNYVLLAWLALAVCSMQNSVDLWASLKGLQKLFKAFGLYLVVLDTADSPRALRRVLVGVLVGLAVVVGDGLWQAVAGRDLIYGKPPAWTIGSVERVIATFDHPASLSIHLVSFCPVLLALGLRGERRWRWPILGVVGLTSVVMVLARTRGGFLAFLLALILLSYWLRHWGPVALAAATIGLQAATMPPTVKAWAASMPSLWDQLTQPDRPIIWQTALNMVKAHPFIGVGVNTFVKAYPSYLAPGDPFGNTGIGPYAHNQYLHLAAELGWPGLALLGVLLVLIVLVVRRTLAARREHPMEAAMSAGLAAGLVGYLVIGLFESSLFYSRGGGTFWFVVGLIVATEALRRTVGVSRPAA